MTLFIVRRPRVLPAELVEAEDRVVYMQADKRFHRSDDADTPIDPAELVELVFEHDRVVVW